jgi:hypothetical protein
MSISRFQHLENIQFTLYRNPRIFPRPVISHPAVPFTQSQIDNMTDKEYQIYVLEAIELHEENKQNSNKTKTNRRSKNGSRESTHGLDPS